MHQRQEQEIDCSLSRHRRMCVDAPSTYHTGTYRTTIALKLEDPHMLESKYARSRPNEGAHERRCGILRRINRTVLTMMRNAGLMWRELRPLARRHDRHSKRCHSTLFFSWDRPGPCQIAKYLSGNPWRRIETSDRHLAGLQSARAVCRDERQGVYRSTIYRHPLLSIACTHIFSPIPTIRFRPLHPPCHPFLVPASDAVTSFPSSGHTPHRVPH